MWKIDDNGNAYNPDTGEKIWCFKEHGNWFIHRTEFVKTKKWRGYEEKPFATFPKSYSEEYARESLFRHVDTLNLHAMFPNMSVKEERLELEARARDRKKLKMFSLF